MGGIDGQVVSWFSVLQGRGAGKGAVGDDWAGAGLPVCRIKNKFAIGAEVGMMVS